MQTTFMTTSRKETFRRRKKRDARGERACTGEGSYESVQESRPEQRMTWVIHTRSPGVVTLSSRAFLGKAFPGKAFLGKAFPGKACGVATTSTPESSVRIRTPLTDTLNRWRRR